MSQVKPSQRKTVRDEDLQPVGKFVVMRHSTKLSRAHFCAVHETYESASAEATRLMVESIAHHPELQHHYYVLEVAARFSGGAEGFASAERRA